MELKKIEWSFQQYCFHFQSVQWEKYTLFVENTASEISVPVIRRSLQIGKGENWWEVWNLVTGRCVRFCGVVSRQCGLAASDFLPFASGPSVCGTHTEGRGCGQAQPWLWHPCWAGLRLRSHHPHTTQPGGEGAPLWLLWSSGKVEILSLCYACNTRRACLKKKITVYNQCVDFGLRWKSVASFTGLG